MLWLKFNCKLKFNKSQSPTGQSKPLNMTQSQDFHHICPFSLQTYHFPKKSNNGLITYLMLSICQALLPGNLCGNIINKYYQLYFKVGKLRLSILPMFIKVTKDVAKIQILVCLTPKYMLLVTGYQHILFIPPHSSHNKLHHKSSHMP